MTRAITYTMATMALLAGSIAPAADHVLVSASRSPSYLSLDQRAANACFDAFVAALLPGRSARIHIAAVPGGENIFTSMGGSPLAPYKVMELEMSAEKAQGGDLLAKSYCRVDRNAKVLRLETHVTDTAKLTDLTLKDIRLAIVSY